MARALDRNAVDAILDQFDEDEDPSRALADLLDRRGAWDWSDGSEHEPSDRLAIIESTGAVWLVYRGTEPDSARRYGSRAEARAALQEQTERVSG